MIHFRDRHDVIDWAAVHIPKSYRTVARSLEEGQVEFLGGFKCFSCMTLSRMSGWMIKVTSKFNKIYYIFVYIDLAMQLRLSIMDTLNWKSWDGDKTDNPLYQGDHPEEYRRLKDEATDKNS